MVADWLGSNDNNERSAGLIQVADSAVRILMVEIVVPIDMSARVSRSTWRRMGTCGYSPKGSNTRPLIIVEAHGGEIFVGDWDGPGAEFVLILRSRKLKGPARSAALRVLIVHHTYFCRKGISMAKKTATVAKAERVSQSPIVSRSGTAYGPICSAPAGNSVSQDAIRLKAYQKWEAAGRPGGDDMRFWLEAEGELLAAK